MKNKPHPRWAQKASAMEISDPQDGCEEPEGANFDMSAAVGSCPPLLSDNSPPSIPGPASPPCIRLSPVASLVGTRKIDDSPLTPQDRHFLTAGFNLPSPPHSSSANSPRSAYSSLPHPSPDATRSVAEFNVDSLISASSFEATGFETGVYGHMLDQIMRADQAKAAGDCTYHSCRPGMRQSCSCINTAAVYNSLLELSVRLRRAAESLGSFAQHRSHSMDSDCHLYSKVRELDRLMSYVTPANTPPYDLHGPSSLQKHVE